MTTQLLVMGIPMVLFVFGLWAGVPLWMVLRHPDRDPREPGLTAESRDSARSVSRPSAGARAR
jgi:hypothetical protein